MPTPLDDMVIFTEEHAIDVEQTNDEPESPTPKFEARSEEAELPSPGTRRIVLTTK